MAFGQQLRHAVGPAKEAEGADRQIEPFQKSVQMFVTPGHHGQLDARQRGQTPHHRRNRAATGRGQIKNFPRRPRRQWPARQLFETRTDRKTEHDDFLRRCATLRHGLTRRLIGHEDPIGRGEVPDAVDHDGVGHHHEMRTDRHLAALHQLADQIAVNRISRNDRHRIFLAQQIPEGRFEIAQRRQRPIENRSLVIKPEKGFPRHRHALDGEIVGHLQGLRGTGVDRDIGIVDIGVVTADGLEGVAHIACRRVVAVTETGGENEDFLATHGDYNWRRDSLARLWAPASSRLRWGKLIAFCSSRRASSLRPTVR